MPRLGTAIPPGNSRALARADHESFLTAPNALTLLRTGVAVPIALAAASRESLALLLMSLSVYWIGDLADGALARLTDRETRIGAVLDILCDRLCAASFYVGLAWIYPDLSISITIYLAQFMVLDAFVSMAFLAWPISSPNYFYVIDQTLWRWNWSKAAKAANSAAFAVLLIATRSMWVGAVVAVGLFALKSWSVVRLSRLGLPIPGGA